MNAKRMPLVLALLLAVATVPGADIAKLRFSWSFPDPLDTNNTFYLLGTTNIAQPLTNWQVLTNVSGDVTQLVVSVEVGRQFFTMTTSNLWGVSPFTNTLPAAPAPVGGFILPIERLP